MAAPVIDESGEDGLHPAMLLETLEAEASAAEGLHSLLAA